MPYRYLEDIATADAAFEAWGKTVEELFRDAADATLNVMVGNLDAISRHLQLRFDLVAEGMDLLLFALLQELIFRKDAEQLLLRVSKARVTETQDGFFLDAEVYGERLNPEKHDLGVDVKAVTFHRFRVEEVDGRWEATVILDI